MLTLMQISAAESRSTSAVPSRRRAFFLPRVDLYGPIHKGLRWASARLLTRMGSSSMADAAEQDAILEDLETLLDLFAKHVAHEEAHLHPALEAHRPGATVAVAEAHVEHERASAELRLLASSLRIASPDTRSAVRRALYLRWSAFFAEQLTHMLDEEETIQPLLDEVFDEDELAAIHARLIASITPDEMLATLRVILPALDRDERVALLAGPRRALPPEAFAAILATGRANLSDADFVDLTTRLDDAA